MATVQARTLMVHNNTVATVDIFVAHRADSTLPLRLQLPPFPQGTQYQYLASTGYYMTDISPMLGLVINLDCEVGPGAVMDYWYVAVNIRGGSAPGAYSVGGSALFPTEAIRSPTLPGFSTFWSHKTRFPRRRPCFPCERTTSPAMIRWEA